MSQPLDVYSHGCCTEQNPELAYSDESAVCTSSSLPKCSSSSSIVTSAGRTDHKKPVATASLVTGWTDSKHSSYLDYMEANFVRSLYSREYCLEDVCGEKPHHHYQHQISEEFDDDSAESRFCSLDETTEFQMADNRDWMWRTASKLNLPTCSIPGLLLKNPWVKHFRTKVSPPSKPNTVPLLSPAASSSNIFTPFEHHERVYTHEIVSNKNPSTTGPKGKRTKVYLFGSRRNGDLEVGESNRWAQESVVGGTVDAIDPGMSNAKKRVLPLTQQEESLARQKVGRVEEDETYELMGGGDGGAYRI